MIEETYCSYEVSKLLKEKGFDEYCRYFYDCETPNTGYLSNKGYGEYIHNSKVYDGRNLAACPTLQMAMKWLREAHNKHCDIGYDIGVKWFFQIMDLKETIEDHYTEMKFYHPNNPCNFKSYEQAVEAALKYVLENLI